VVISGTVSDISAGSEQQAVAANFPNGLPCVSDESMTGWMKYVYMQQPLPATVTGVPVMINVLDANNNYRTIGTTVSDGSGFFSYSWTPDVPGKYTVVAIFEGSESYYPSNSEAAFFAMDVPVATPQPTQGPASLADQYLLPATVGIIAAIVIVGAAILLMLRKK
jgi:hypothetical protein